MRPRAEKFTLFIVLVLAVPTAALAADWILTWRAGSCQTVASQQTAQEVQKLYQLRELCNQSNAIEKRWDFVALKSGQKRAYWNGESPRLESDAAHPPNVPFYFGPVTNFTGQGLYFAAAGSQTSALIVRRNFQIQNLRDRNSRFLEKIFSDVAKYGTEQPSVWSTVQAKREELAQIIRSGEFQACMTELDEVLPARAKQGGRQ